MRLDTEKGVQGSQFTSREWQIFLSQHNLESGMSRRGNCHDNAVAEHDNAVVESIFQLLKRERLRWKPTRLATQPDKRCLTTSGCSTPRNASTQTTVCCHPLTMKSNNREWTRQVSGRAPH
ncbi:putative integrase [Celeribacter baekdonensis B30]|uniref:Putative integrase n=1 Tax=Celeribacter baekdonensis B30 TaxID=1208323 RepID=K2JBX3_9RHOB|nr:putative integrase [Celeribacter baekdonensis B30]